MENGVPNGSGPEIAACEAATPKISTGIDSGNTSTASSSPPRCSVTANAAPIMPVKVSAGVPASRVSATASVDAGVEIEQQPKHRRRDDQRQPGGDPMRQRLGGAGQLKRRAAHDDEIERTIVMIGHE